METFKRIAEGGVGSPAGYQAAAATCGLKASGRPDLALVYSQHDCTAAAVFTQNQVAAAPVLVDRDTLAANRSRLRGVVANAGIANACTGAVGLAHARTMQQMVAAELDCRPEQFFVLSTGVIGVQLPMDKVQRGIRTAVGQLAAGEAAGRLAAEAIMTTDTRPKHLALQVALPAGVVTLGGMAKGAGMIHPNMATMLAVLTTDAAVPADALQGLLATAVNRSFNCISVDGDTSTNDTVLLLANGASGVAVADEDSLAQFGRALQALCLELAHMIVGDGEGATKLVEIQVSGAASEADAQAVARTIATSPLVKTAFAGSDPNWGRILAAAGRAGVVFDQNQIGLWIGAEEGDELQLVAGGLPVGYAEADAARIFTESTFKVRLDLGGGGASTLVWTTDLTHDYITINADYRT